MMMPSSSVPRPAFASASAFSTTTTSRSSLLLLYVFALVSSCCVSAQQTFFPGSVPLSARSTYLNAYVSYTNQSAFGSTWPRFDSYPHQVVGWTGLVRVDGAAVSVSFLGDIILANTTAANVSAVSLTPTKTVLSIAVGAMALNVSFLSPIEPGDFVRQSVPFSYMAIECASTDGNAHTVQVFTDVTGEWLSGDRNQIMTWSTTVDDGASIVYHSAQLQTPLEFSEISGQAQWGTLYYATPKDTRATYRTGFADVSRNLFITTGALDGSKDTNFRPISTDWPTLAFAYDLGSIKATQSPIVFAVGFTQDNAIKYTDLSATSTQRSPLYAVNFTDPTSLVSFVLNDYSDAQSRTAQLDARLTSAASSAGGAAYSDLVNLAARQVFGSTQLTVGLGSDGKLNKTDVMMFMRDTNGGSPGRVQPVDTMYAVWPFIMTVDPTLGPALLEPLFRFQQSSQYTIQFAAQDLGVSYPNATGANNAHNQGIEQSANMIIMTYAHALFSGDGSVIARYYSLLKTWTNTLVGSALMPTSSQASADGLTVANQTNLAIKGIIAISVMSKISAIVNNPGDSQQYSNNATSLYNQWKSMALGQGNKMLLAYGKPDTWTLGYNLFADKWLGINMVDSFIYAGQATQLQSFMSNSANAAESAYGLPTDSSSLTTITPSWNMLTAAYIPDSSVQSAIITRIHNRANLASTADGLPQSYNSTSGAGVSGFASPALGAAFGQVALSISTQSVSVPVSTGSSNDGSGGSSITGPVVGGVVGGIAIMAALGGLAWFLRGRRQQKQSRMDIVLDERETPYKDHLATPAPYTYTDADAHFHPGTHSNDSIDSSTPALQPAEGDRPGDEGQFVPYHDSEPRSESSGSRTTTDPYSSRSTSSRGPSELRAVSVDTETFDGVSRTPSRPLPSTKLIAEMRRMRDAGSIPPSMSSVSGRTATSPTRSEADAAAQLREEVANLRREMEEIRLERVEPPPRYDAP